MTETTKAVVLARGLGTRMRARARVGSLDPSQRAAADSGLKAMIPIHRPFLDYLISALADAGIVDVCLVVGPGQQRIREYLEREVVLTRVRVHFAVQEAPRGTADAVLAAESFAGDDHVLVLNSDNYYPAHTLRALRELGAAGVAAFERDALVRLGNIDADRVTKYSVIDVDERGLLRRIVEKPDAGTVAAMGDEVYVGMNSWSLPPEIYRACREAPPSKRGEIELPTAVQIVRDDYGVPFHVLKFHDAVLDLSSRGDIASVVEHLRDVVPRL